MADCRPGRFRGCLPLARLYSASFILSPYEVSDVVFCTETMWESFLQENISFELNKKSLPHKPFCSTSYFSCTCNMIFIIHLRGNISAFIYLNCLSVLIYNLHEHKSIQTNNSVKFHFEYMMTPYR